MAGDEMLLQLNLSAPVSNFHKTSKVDASIQKTTPDPSTTYTRPSETTGAVKTASVNSTAPIRPRGVVTLLSGTLPECSESYLNWSQFSSAVAANVRERTVNSVIIVFGILIACISYFSRFPGLCR